MVTKYSKTESRKRHENRCLASAVHPYRFGNINISLMDRCHELGVTTKLNVSLTGCHWKPPYRKLFASLA